jgi:putative ABC transport system permease protein
VKAKSLDEQAIPETYFPALGSAANPDLVDAMLRGMTYVVRTTGDPLALTTSVRNVVHAMDPELPLSHVESGEMLVSQSMNNRRFTTLLFGAFAVLALVLAATGIYGLIAYSVTQRQREIGVRMAIGATEARVVRLILREGAWTAALGTALGVLGAVALTRVMRSLLFGVGALDLVTFAAAPALLIVVALFSSWLPARRAARVDPSASMR